MIERPRLGVFGGTFDPPHVGHLVAAVNVAHALHLDEVLMIVAGVPWQKVGQRPISDAADRMHMVRLATEGRSDLVPSDLEMGAGTDSVTADTLERLADRRPDHDLVVVVGSDVAAGLASWRRPETVATLATIAVVDRPGATGGRPPSMFSHEVVPCPLVDVSSSDLRARVAARLPIDYLVPDSVRDFIHERHLYR